MGMGNVCSSLPVVGTEFDALRHASEGFYCMGAAYSAECSCCGLVAERLCAGIGGSFVFAIDFNEKHEAILELLGDYFDENWQPRLLTLL